MTACYPNNSDVMFSDVMFSQVREDWRIEWQVLDRLAQTLQKPLRVLIVASGGCTALSLLAHPGLAQLDAVDANLAQLELLRLRSVAVAELEPAEQWVFLAKSGVGLGAERLGLYDRLRPQLPVTTRAFWDARQDEIAYGVNYVGRFEQLFRELAQAFVERGLNPLIQPEMAIATSDWREIFEQVFERQKLVQTFGEAAVNYSMDRSFGEHFADVFARSLRRFAPQENYFLTQVWGDRYADLPDGRPLYLEPEMVELVRSNLSKLHLHLGQFREKLSHLGTTYDLIQFSNLSDWMPIPELQAMLATIRASLNPGGAVIGRRLNGDHNLLDLVAAQFAVDREFSQHLQKTDRSFFYPEVVVGWR
jgi:S-adenosylmethionine-diacylglycerol 3-amino-3-carboxypropyl transferase